MEMTGAGWGLLLLLAGWEEAEEGTEEEGCCWCCWWWWRAATALPPLAIWSPSDWTWGGVSSSLQSNERHERQQNRENREFKFLKLSYCLAIKYIWGPIWYVKLLIHTLIFSTILFLSILISLYSYVTCTILLRRPNDRRCGPVSLRTGRTTIFPLLWAQSIHFARLPRLKFKPQQTQWK